MRAVFARKTQKNGKRYTSLSMRFAFAAAAVAALTMALAAIILYFTWAQQFDIYIKEGLQDTASGAATMLSYSYEANGGWTALAFMRLPRYGILSGLGLQVIEPNGHIIYDDSFATGATGHIIGPPAGATQPAGSVVIAPVVADGIMVGHVRVWPLSPQGLLTENDIRFRESSIIAMVVAALISVGAASLAGVGFAMTFVRPIDKIIDTADSLRSGDQSARTELFGDDTIGVLGKTLDQMADAIQADRNLERRLTADVAHELRTPLQAIQATVEAMQDGVYPVDCEHLEIVRNETIRLSRLADGILELTRLECGSMQMNLIKLDPADVVREAVDIYAVLLEAADMSVDVVTAQGLVIKADKDRLVQAVGNLLSNAARYSPAGGQVTVTLRSEGKSAVIEVADTGIGIAEKDLGQVFSRFWRADEARDRASGGLGIGLSIVKEIVDRHSGKVSADSRCDGGSVFTIEIPLAL